MSYMYDICAINITHMISVRLSPDIEKRLAELSEKTGRKALGLYQLI